MQKDTHCNNEITDIETLYKARCRGRHGPFPKQTAMYKHLPFLYHLALNEHALQVVELGVHTGQSTAAFLAALKKTGGHLWSCDIKLPQPPIDGFMDEDRWHFVLGDSRQAVEEAPLTIDILFVDAALEHRLADLEAYGKWVKRDGYILVHDTEKKVTREAIKKYLSDKIWRYTEIKSGHGLGVIHVI